MGILNMKAREVKEPTHIKRATGENKPTYAKRVNITKKPVGPKRPVDPTLPIVIMSSHGGR